jgi:hypothetical protein
MFEKLSIDSDSSTPKTFAQTLISDLRFLNFDPDTNNHTIGDKIVINHNNIKIVEKIDDLSRFRGNRYYAKKKRITYEKILLILKKIFFEDTRQIRSRVI